MWNVGGALHTQLAHGLEPHVFTLLGDVLPGATLVVGAIDDLVVDVGDVGSEAHFEARIREVTAQDVVDQGCAAVTQVGWPVDGGATEIDADLARVAKRQGFHPLGGGVIEVQHSDKPTI